MLNHGVAQHASSLIEMVSKVSVLRLSKLAYNPAWHTIATYRKIRVFAQTINPTQEVLHLSVSRTRLILRNHVATQVNSAERQSTLFPPVTEHTSACCRAQIQLGVIRNIEVVPFTRRCRETLSAIESHVLNHHNCAIHEQNHVQHPVTDYGLLVFLDHAREHTETRWRASICCKNAAGALIPRSKRRIDGFLDISAIKID